MVDKTQLVRTSEVRRPFLEFGNGITGGEIWDTEVFVEDGIIKKVFLIKMTDELVARYGDLIKPEDIKDGFTLWTEASDLVVPMTDNPSNPRAMSLRSFDHQPTPLSLVPNVLINSMQRMSKEIANLRMSVHTEQENNRKFMEGTGFSRMKEIIHEVISIEIGKLATLLTRKG